MPAADRTLDYPACVLALGKLSYIDWLTVCWCHNSSFHLSHSIMLWLTGLWFPSCHSAHISAANSHTSSDNYILQASSVQRTDTFCRHLLCTWFIVIPFSFDVFLLTFAACSCTLWRYLIRCLLVCSCQLSAQHCCLLCSVRFIPGCSMCVRLCFKAAP